MTISVRARVFGHALVVMGLLAQASADAAAPFAGKQAPGYFRTKVGAFEVTALFDGGGQIDPKLLHADIGKINQLMARVYAWIPIIYRAAP